MVLQSIHLQPYIRNTSFVIDDLLKAVLGGVRDIALFIISHEQNQLTRFAIFISLFDLNWLLSRDRLLPDFV